MDFHGILEDLLASFSRFHEILKPHLRQAPGALRLSDLGLGCSTDARDASEALAAARAPGLLFHEPASLNR